MLPQNVEYFHSKTTRGKGNLFLDFNRLWLGTKYFKYAPHMETWDGNFTLWNLLPNNSGLEMRSAGSIKAFWERKPNIFKPPNKFSLNFGQKFIFLKMLAQLYL